MIILFCARATNQKYNKPEISSLPIDEISGLFCFFGD